MDSAVSKVFTKAAGVLVLFAIIAFFKWAISSIKKSNAEKPVLTFSQIFVIPTAKIVRKFGRYEQKSLFCRK